MYGERVHDILDADNDGDVDLDDLLLVSEWLARLLSLFLDVTICVIPIGAVVGTILTVIGASLMFQALGETTSHCTSVLDAFVARGVLPAVHQEIELSSYMRPLTINAVLCLVLDILVIVNGFIIRVKRARRKIEDARDDRVCGCTPTRANAESKGCGLTCVRWTSATVQGLFAVIGTLYTWVVIALAYVASLFFVLGYGIFYLLRAYCDKLQPLAMQNLQVIDSHLNATVPLVNQAMEQTYEVIGLQRSVASVHPASAILFQSSPIPHILEFVGASLPIAESYVGVAVELLDTASDYSAFLSELCVLSRPLPDLFRRCLVGSILLLLGQTILAKYHHSYSTIWYYELALRRSRNRRKLAEQQLGDAATTWPGGADDKESRCGQAKVAPE